jgi:hypothetical protein
MQKKVLPVMLLVALCAVAASAQTPAPAPAATSNKVMRWNTGGDVQTVGKDQMKVLTTDNAKIAVTLVDMWKDATAVRIQVTNLGSEPLTATPDAFTIVAKGDTIAAVPADALSKKIRVRSDHEAEMAGQQAMHYASANGSGEKDEQNRIRSEGNAKADYIRDSALAPALQPRFQTISHIYFPYLKKRDEILVRVTLGGITYEFPFQKSDIHPAY